MSELEEMTLTKLKSLAKQHNIKNISKLKKDELILMLKQVLNSTEVDTEDTTENNDEEPAEEKAEKEPVEKQR